MKVTMRLSLDVTADWERLVADLSESIGPRPTQGAVARELAGRLADHLTEYGANAHVHDTEILMGL